MTVHEAPQKFMVGIFAAEKELCEMFSFFKTQY